MALIGNQYVIPLRTASRKPILADPMVLPSTAGILCVPVRLSGGKFSLARVAPAAENNDLAFPARFSTGRRTLVQVPLGTTGCDCCDTVHGYTPDYWTITVAGLTDEFAAANGTFDIHLYYTAYGVHCYWIENYGGFQYFWYMNCEANWVRLTIFQATAPVSTCAVTFEYPYGIPWPYTFPYEGHATICDIVGITIPGFGATACYSGIIADASITLDAIG